MASDAGGQGTLIGVDISARFGFDGQLAAHQLRMPRLL